MRVSQTGVDLIKYYEGFRLEAYLDVAGIWTIGYGHIGPLRIDGRSYDSVASAVAANGGQPVRISADYAEELLRDELKRFEQGVDSAVKRDINQNQFDAFVSLSYNIGLGAFGGSSALKFFNQGKIAEAADAITWWNKATVNGHKQVVQGLVNRRAAEKALFLQPVDASEIGDTESDSTRITPEENSPRRENLGRSRTIEGAVVAGAGGAASAGAAWMGGEEDEDTTSSGDGATTGQPETPQPQTPAEQPGDASGTDTATDSGDSTTGDSSTGDTGTEDSGAETPAGDSGEAPANDNTGTEISAPPVDEGGISNREYTEAFQIIVGVIIVIAVLYIIFARIDDWRNHKR